MHNVISALLLIALIVIVRVTYVPPVLPIIVGVFIVITNFDINRRKGRNGK